MTITEYLLTIQFNQTDLLFFLVPLYAPPKQDYTHEELMKFIGIQQKAFMMPIPVHPSNNEFVIDKFFSKYSSVLRIDLMKDNYEFFEYAQKYLSAKVPFESVEISPVQKGSVSNFITIDVATIK